ncbi:MAG: DNA polymerase I [Cyanobacteria bacterium SZAS-4]|nr:DNA polymerase I [Cyanobacteria bacterium SZAS-4]
MKPDETLVLVDGSSLAFRSFFALFKSGLRRQDGRPTWAVYGFFNSLFDVIEKQRPHGLAVCFDLAGPTFREKEFADYKANRSEMPDDLAVQWPLIKDAVQFLGIPLYELEGFEADDVIGTVTKLAVEKGIKVQILTGDKDAFQLVDDTNDSVRVLMPGQKELIVYDRAKVFEKLGVWPEQVIDYKGLCGDTSDNIPGVRGIGPVTAVQLLTAYGTIEGIYEHLDEIKSKSVKQKLTDGKQSAFDSKRCATMVMDVKLDFDFDHCQLNSPPLEAVQDYFRNLEFKTMVNRLPKIMARFNEYATAGVATTGGTSRSVEVSAYAGGGSSGGGGAAVAVQVESATIIIEPIATLALPPTPDVVISKSDLDSVVSKLSSCPVFCVDLELSGASSLESEILGYAFAWSKDLSLDSEHALKLSDNYDPESWAVETAYIPVHHAEANQLTPEAISAALKPLLENKSIGKVVMNCKAKMNALSLQGIKLDGIVFDPMLASYLINPDEKHSLKDQSERLLGYSTVRSAESAAAGKKQLTINFAAVDKVATSAADDARVTLELTRLYMTRLDHDQRYLLYEMEIPLAGTLARMEQNGVALDLPYLNQFSVELSNDLSRLENEIYELAGHPFNINSPIQLQKVLFEELNLKTKGKTKTGYSTDATVLEALAKEHIIVPKILEYRQLSKLRSTYVDALPKSISPRDNRLHGEFNQATTATGRLSSSNPNLQNIPIRSEVGRRIRKAFIPQNPESFLLSADYSQIELRLLAHMCSDEILIDAFNKNQDIHARTSGEIFDVPIEQVTSEMRRIGKTLNFALVYQQGAFATGQDLGISTREAQSFIDKYFARYPKVRGFLTQTIDEARQTGYVSTLWGRKRYFRFLNDRSDPVRKADERAACNAPIQGSAADLMKLAMIRLDKELTTRAMKTKLIMQVHDELVLEVPEDELELAKEVVLQSMQMDQPLQLPLKVDLNVGKNWEK